MRIFKAIKITRRWGVHKRIIMTDYIVAQEETYTRGNSKKMVLKDLISGNAHGDG
jgi:hypothetical protein